MSKLGLEISVVLSCLLLTACMKAQDTTSQALDTVGTETSSSYNKMRDALDLGSKPKPPPKKIAQPRYCYKTYEDIVCYARPLPGEEYRLVGYQNTAGKTGYTLPPTVPPKDAADGNASASKPAQPPLVKSEPDTNKDDKQLKEIIFDPSELEPKVLVPEQQQ